MDWSSKNITEWRDARDSQAAKASSNLSVSVRLHTKWVFPDPGAFKLNVDAAFYPGAASFSVGLVIFNHARDFVASRTSCQAMVSTVVESEARAILEVLYWVSSMSYEVVAIESDSIVNVRSLQGASDNLLEVGHIWMLAVLFLILGQIMPFLLLKYKRIGLLIW
ncbi:hypothetical protein AgCh_036631 [Apium graveolens]